MQECRSLPTSNMKNWQNLASMKDVGSGVCVKNTSDLVSNEIHGILQKNPTKEQINEYKMTEREIYEQFGNLSKEKLNTKSNKNVSVKNVVMTAIIKRCRGKKKRSVRAIDGFRNKLMIPDSEISVSRIWSQIKNRKVVYEWQNPWRIFFLGLWYLSFFYEHHKKKKVDKNWCKYILFRIDVYFTESLLAVEINEPNHESR